MLQFASLFMSYIYLFNRYITLAIGRMSNLPDNNNPTWTQSNSSNDCDMLGITYNIYNDDPQYSQWGSTNDCDMLGITHINIIWYIIK